MLPFVMSESGEYLAWDVTHRDSADELPIYVIVSRMGGIRYGANDLYQFVENCTDSTAIKAMFGPGYHSLLPTFEPLPMAT